MSDQSWNPNPQGQPSAPEPQPGSQSSASDPYATVDRSRLNPPPQEASSYQQGYQQQHYQQQAYDPYAQHVPQQGYQAPQQGYDPYVQPPQGDQYAYQQQQFGYGPPVQQGQPQQPVGPKPNTFMHDLFDMSFSRFVTPAVASAVYTWVVIFAAIYAITSIIQAFMYGPIINGLISLVVSPVMAFAFIALARVLIEGVVALVRVAENTGKLAEAAKDDDEDESS